MKKILSIIAAAALITASAQPALAYQKYVYTASGIMESEVRAQNDDRLTAIGAPGAIVFSDYGVFDKKIDGPVYKEYILSHSCYGSSSCKDTLTLGLSGWANGFTYETTRESLQRCVYNQISYIQRIGGVMTGYTIQPHYDLCALSISWDVDGAHHYARFARIASGFRLDTMILCISTIVKARI